MCDELTEADSMTGARAGMTRRGFAAAGMATGIAAAVALALPRVHALAVIEQDVLITTPDGEADASSCTRKGRPRCGFVWPDILGCALPSHDGTRLAEAGYAVLVINPYYRMAPSPVVSVGESFCDPATRERIMPFARALPHRPT